MEGIMDKKQRVKCPTCQKLMLISLRSVAVTAVEDTASLEVNEEPLSKLHVAALQDIVDSRTITPLRQAIKEIQVEETRAELFLSGYNNNVPAEQEAFMHSRIFSCPGCAAELALLLDFYAIAVLPAQRDKDHTVRIERVLGIDNDTYKFLDACREFGIMQAYTDALRQEHELKKVQNPVMKEQFPKSVEKYFLNFLNNLKEYYPNKNFFSEVLADLDQNKVRFWQANGVCIISYNDKIYRFVPIHLLQRSIKFESQTTVAKIITNSVKNNKAQNGELIWIRSKFGYVPLGSQIFLAELRKKNFGAFANPKQ